MKSSRILGVAVLVAAFAGAGCVGRATPIRTLMDDPSRYDHQLVRIAGTVGSSIGVLGYGAYQVDDGTGTITVVSRGGGAPREGARVGVEGEFRSAYVIETRTAAVLIERRRATR